MRQAQLEHLIDAFGAGFDAAGDDEHRRTIATGEATYDHRVTERPVTNVEVFVDPSCPWAWITSRWLKEVAPRRDLVVTWRSFCLEIRDEYGVAPTMPEERRAAALAGHALSHRMLRVFEAVRAQSGEAAVDALLTAWGQR